MRERFAVTALLLTLASIVGYSAGFSSGRKVNCPSKTAAQSASFYPAAFPVIDPRWMKGARTPRDRSVAIVTNERKWPSGTRLYVSDAVAIRDGNHLTIPSFSESVRKRADGRIVLLDSKGRLVELFPRSAVLQVQKDALVQAVIPGQALPNKFRRAKPFEVIK